MKTEAGTGKPDPWVQKYAALVPQGPVLDLACGKGRHGRYFLDLGYSVTFIDKDIYGVEDLSSQGFCPQDKSPHNNANTQLIKHNLENNSPWPFHPNQFSGIVVTNYLYRPLLPQLITTLKPGGIIIYKTFAMGNEQFGKPKNPDFLLRENELRTAFNKKFREIAFFQGREMNPDRITQAICVQRIA